MGRGRFHRMDRQQRFEDMEPAQQNDAASFFFDLRLMLPSGMTAHDVQMARQAVEHRLQRVLRKKDRIVWTADGFFLSIGTGHPARAAAAAERIHEDIRELLASKKPDEARHHGELYESKQRPKLRRDASPFVPARVPHN